MLDEQHVVRLCGKAMVRNGQELHRRRKERLHWWSGLRLGRTNTNGWYLARHWPHCLCWSWQIQVAPQKHRRFLFKWFKYRNNGGVQWQLRLLWVTTLSWHQQRDDWMQSDGAHRYWSVHRGEDQTHER